MIHYKEFKLTKTGVKKECNKASIFYLLDYGYFSATVGQEEGIIFFVIPKIQHLHTGAFKLSCSEEIKKCQKPF